MWRHEAAIVGVHWCREGDVDSVGEPTRYRSASIHLPRRLAWHIQGRRGDGYGSRSGSELGTRFNHWNSTIVIWLHFRQWLHQKLSVANFWCCHFRKFSQIQWYKCFCSYKKSCCEIKTVFRSYTFFFSGVEMFMMININSYWIEPQVFPVPTYPHIDESVRKRRSLRESLNATTIRSLSEATHQHMMDLFGEFLISTSTTWRPSIMK